MQLLPRVSLTLKKLLHAPALLYLGLLLAITLGLYLPGIQGDFLFDDLINITKNQQSYLFSLEISEIWKVLNSGVASTIGRPISMLSFGLNFYFSEQDPSAYKLTNIVIHLITTLVAYLLIAEILKIGMSNKLLKPEKENTRKLFALLITACWALHPLNVSTVLYVVQRMTELSALSTFAFLYYYCKLRQKTSLTLATASMHLIAMLTLLTIGVLSKENAVIAVPLAVIIEIYLFRFKFANKPQAILVKTSGILLFLIPGICAFILLLLKPEEIVGNYAIRDFSMFERLLTQSRVLWTYIHWIIFPDISAFAFHHDNFSISRSLFSPLSTLFSALGIIALLACIPVLFKRLPWLSFGLAFFFCGHVLESSIVALELVFEHRNYLPSLGLITGILISFSQLSNEVFNKKISLCLAILYLLFLSDGTYREVIKWSDERAHLFTILEKNPESHRINYSLASVFSTGGLQNDDPNALRIAREYYQRSGQFSSIEIRGQAGVIVMNGLLDEETDPSIVDELETRILNSDIKESIVAELHYLTDCFYQQECGDNKDILVRTFNAIINNSNVQSLLKQSILDGIADIIFYGYGNIDDALALLYTAQTLNDAITNIDIKIIELEILKENYSAARNHLDIARQKNTVLADFNSVLDRLGNQLSENQSQNQGPDSATP